MAGSLAHIVDEDGEFTMATIENLGDAFEALEECYRVLRAMDVCDVSRACADVGVCCPMGLYK